VEAQRLQALSRREDRYVVAVAGGRPKVEAVLGAVSGRFMNVLVTDEDCAVALTTPRRRRSV
jgi:DNA-binding transcriptional regulator LsrR (DeoR family)